ncbi:hypothetical protein Rs2_40678 [Raphanus sativus]|nr:hypothetical protein Rs2_40678 [Raphanus sativus]
MNPSRLTTVDERKGFDGAKSNPSAKQRLLMPQGRVRLPRRVVGIGFDRVDKAMAEDGELFLNSSRYRYEALVNSVTPLTHGCRVPRSKKRGEQVAIWSDDRALGVVEAVWMAEGLVGET